MRTIPQAITGAVPNNCYRSFVKSMVLYVIEISRYLIAAAAVLYTLASFMVFYYKNETRRNGLYLLQNVLMFSIQLISFVQMTYTTGNTDLIFFMAFQVVILLATLMLFHMLYPAANRLVVNNMCFLLMVGLIILTRLSLARAVRQFIIACASIVIGFFLPFIISKWKSLRHLTWVYALTGLSALSVVLILGRATFGAKITYTVAGVTFQPSEFVKILFVFFIACAFAKATDIKQVLIVSAVAAAHVLVLVLSKDLGSALIYFVVYLTMLFVATHNYLYLFGGLIAGSGAALIAYKMFTHIQIRVQAWRDPWSVIDSTGYQVTQSLFGISSGGLFGLGLFGGNPEAIPLVSVDFIFSAVTEELGIIFGVCLTLVCLSSFLMIMYQAYYLRDLFYQLVAFGIGVMYIFQVFLTIGGGAKFVPLTGVTLPLVSYGGTSVLVTIVTFFIFEGLCVLRAKEHEKAIERLERMEQRELRERRRRHE